MRTRKSIRGADKLQYAKAGAITARSAPIRRSCPRPSHHRHDKIAPLETPRCHRRQKYRTEASLPEAFRNFLVLLGVPGNEDELTLRTKRIMQRFSLEGVAAPTEFLTNPSSRVQHAVSAQNPIEDLTRKSREEAKAQQFVEAGNGSRRRFTPPMQ